jgi:hypothetical protein
MVRTSSTTSAAAVRSERRVEGERKLRRAVDEGPVEVEHNGGDAAGHGDVPRRLLTWTPAMRCGMVSALD